MLKSLSSSITGLSSKVYLIVIAALLGVVLIFGSISYFLFNKNLKTEVKNQKLSIDILRMDKEHTKELILLSEEIREQEVQKSDLEAHNKILQKTIKRKSNVNTKAKDFKSRNITKFSF